MERLQKLVPIAAEHLRVDEPMPFGLRDASGRLLLAAGQKLTSREHLQQVSAQRLFALEHESSEWRRRLAAAMDAKFRQGASLKDVTAATPEAGRQAPRAPEITLAEEWLERAAQLDAALRDIATSDEWVTRLLTIRDRARALAQRRFDASLYYLIYEAGHAVEQYSCKHALLTFLICEQAAGLLGWPAQWVDSLGKAALTMNVAMLRLQDELAATTQPLTDSAREAIAGHAAAGAALLGEHGLDDPLAVAAVALHHDSSGAELPLAALPPERQLARLVRRVDIFTARLSLRGSRPSGSPMQAARDACLGANGTPDEIGSALLKAVGLYPPGTFVRLASGEQGVVVARGRRANLPYVASLIAASGNLLIDPVLRDTIERRHAVVATLRAEEIKVRPPHDRLMSMR